jgi:hypothetical protein
VLIWVKPARRGRFSISLAALREVAAVAPGQRGWDAMAMRPPGASPAVARRAGRRGLVPRPRRVAEADLEDLVGGLHPEQRDYPAVALPVGRAVGYLP